MRGAARLSVLVAQSKLFKGSPVRELHPRRWVVFSMGTVMLAGAVHTGGSIQLGHHLV